MERALAAVSSPHRATSARKRSSIPLSLSDGAVTMWLAIRANACEDHRLRQHEVQEDLPCSSPLSRELTGAIGRTIGSVQGILGDDRQKRGWRPWGTWANNPPDPMWGDSRRIPPGPGPPVALGRADTLDYSDILIRKMRRNIEFKTQHAGFNHTRWRAPTVIRWKKKRGWNPGWPGSEVTWS